MASVAVEQDSDSARTHVALNRNANWLLYSGIKSLLRCDEAEVVEGIAHYVISQHRSIRVVSRFVERTKRTPIPALLTLLAWSRSFLAVYPERPLCGATWSARLSNERRAIEPLIALAPDVEWTELKFRSRISVRRALRLAMQNSKSVFRVYKIARRMHLHFDSFKAMRVVELLGYYARYLELFNAGNFYVALTSNHSNPHGIAFNLAARKCGVPVVLISHGMPIRPVARLQYDLAVVHCDAAGQTYLDEGCEIGRVLTHGRKQDHLTMADSLPPQINVGIFLCKDVNETRLKALVENLLRNDRVARILIRPHPKDLWVRLDSWIASHADERLFKSCGPTAFDDMKGLHLVFGGNSSVLIESVTAGIPSAYVEHLDHGPPDLHRFVAAGLVYRSEVEVDLNEILRFYQRPGWQQVLRRFANIDDNETEVLEKMRLYFLRTAAKSASAVPPTNSSAPPTTRV
jgi:hypothetical protein